MGADPFGCKRSPHQRKVHFFSAAPKSPTPNIFFPSQPTPYKHTSTIGPQHHTFYLSASPRWHLRMERARGSPCRMHPCPQHRCAGQCIRHPSHQLTNPPNHYKIPIIQNPTARVLWTRCFNGHVRRNPLLPSPMDAVWPMRRLKATTLLSQTERPGST